MPGFTSKIFEAGTDNVTCPICLKVLKNPWQCPSGHVLYEGCIFDSVQRGNRCCPVATCDITAASLTPNLLAKTAGCWCLVQLLL